MAAPVKSKKILKVIKLQIPAGKANPAPPIGPALGSTGVNIMGFCKEFNAKTQAMAGDILPVVITVFADKSFSFILKVPPMSRLILKRLKKEKGSAVPNRDKIGFLTYEDLVAIAKEKSPDLNILGPDCIESAINCVAGTARSMGVEIKK
jgi:large subunit ribosomal protein L11